MKNISTHKTEVSGSSPEWPTIGIPPRRLKEKSDMAATKSELDKAREAGKIEARKEVGEWIEANMLEGPYRTVYSDIFPPMIQHLKAGKRL